MWDWWQFPLQPSVLRNSPQLTNLTLSRQPCIREAPDSNFAFVSPHRWFISPIIFTGWSWALKLEGVCINTGPPAFVRFNENWVAWFTSSPMAFVSTRTFEGRISEYAVKFNQKSFTKSGLLHRIGKFRMTWCWCLKFVVARATGHAKIWSVSHATRK